MSIVIQSLVAIALGLAIVAFLVAGAFLIVHGIVKISKLTNGEENGE